MANGIVLKGDWRRARSMFGKMTEANKILADEILNEMAFEVKDKLTEVLDSSPSPANTASTEKKKGFNDPLHWKGELQEDDSVIVERKWEDNRHRYTIKGNPDKTDERTGSSMEDIITIAEEGGAGVPPRNVLSITYSEMAHKIKGLCIKRLNEELFR